MLARCARCQGTFQTDRFGVQTCPHCGGEIHLADPASAADGAGGASPPPPPATPSPSQAPGAPPEPPRSPWAGGPPTWDGRGGDAPPPPPGGYGSPPGGGYGPRPPFDGPGAQGEIPAPFADRARLGFVKSWLATWKLAAIEPGSFFRRVRIDQPGSAVLFGVIASSLGTWAQAFWTSMTAASTRAQLAELADKIPPEWSGMARMFSQYTERATSGTVLAGQVVFAPLAALVSIFLSAAVFHALLLLFRGANRGFDATLTVVGYAMGISVLQLIPECGALVSPIWIAVVLIIGFAEAHRCGTGKGAAAVLLPLVLACACACAAIGMAIGAAGLGAGAAGAGPVSF